MKRFGRVPVLGVLLAMVMLLTLVLPAAGANPTVSITVSAETISITNTQSAWAIGTVAVDDVVYFSADGTQEDNYSRIENTGNANCDIEIQGTNIEGGDYDWTLSNTGTAGDQICAIHAITGNGSGTYTTVVKTSAYNDLTTNLSTSEYWDWSMKWTSPTAFNASDDGSSKSGTITLVASAAS